MVREDGIMKIVELYPEKQGRPFSPPVVRVSTGSVTSASLTNSAIDAIISYIATYEAEVQSYEGEVQFYI